MKNLKIGKKLLVTFSVILAFFVALVATSIFSLVSTADNFTDFYETPFVITTMTAELRANIQEFAKYIGYASMESDTAKTAQYIQSAQDTLQKLRDGTAYMRENFSEANSITDAYDNVMRSVMTQRDQVLELASRNRNTEAAQLYFSEVMPAFVQANQYLADIDTLAQNQAVEYYQGSMRQKDGAQILVILISLITLAVTIVLGMYITKCLKKPIFEIESAAKQMAQGHLEVSVTYESKDELGSLSENMRLMCKRIKYYMDEISNATTQLAAGDLNVKKLEPFLGDFLVVQTTVRQLVGSLDNTLGQINQASDQVASGSEQVSSGAQALSQGATEQASAVEELAATVNEISQQISDTAHNAEEARTQTAKSGSEIVSCNKQMQEMIGAMSEISDKSDQISKIIKTIEDIAFQTNILALNAAVEAARAGAAGKGFAVVADEVRNLAGKSAEASKSTAALIESTVQAVEKGSGIANSTAQSLDNVVETVKGVVTVVDKIASATEQQSASVAQVTQGIEQISSVVQTNSATAEESAAASEELSGQAQTLKGLVAKFKLRDGDTSTGGSSAAGQIASGTTPTLPALAQGNEIY